MFLPTDTFSCPCCYRVYSYPIFLQRHLWKTHQYTQSNAFDFVNKMYSNSLQNDQNEKKKESSESCSLNIKNKCEICGKGFKRKEHLIKHQVVHTGERRFSCETCGRKFTEKSYLVKHTRIHVGSKPFKCEKCSSSFSESSKLARHRLTHNTEKAYKCEICSIFFADFSNFKRHGSVHTGEKPFKCDICFASFTQNSSLKRHRRKHTVTPVPTKWAARTLFLFIS